MLSIPGLSKPPPTSLLAGVFSWVGLEGGEGKQRVFQVGRGGRQGLTPEQGSNPQDDQKGFRAALPDPGLLATCGVWCILSCCPTPPGPPPTLTATDSWPGGPWHHLNKETRNQSRGWG